jgi:CheY-like chemotaxis protein
VAQKQKPEASDGSDAALSAASGNSLTSRRLFHRGDVTMASTTVLCIDDRPQVLELRKATLESHDYCVKLATSGYTAMKILEETSVAAVLLEYKVEGMDAEAVAYHIKQRFPNLPIILLSAYCEMPERILWLVDDYVMKSELPEGLVRIIERRLAPRSNKACERSGAAAQGC